MSASRAYLRAANYLAVAVNAIEDVDTDKLAVYGVSQGGYWVSRALAFEHRFADVARRW